MPAAARNMTAVETHPSTLCRNGSLSAPVTFGLAVIGIITTMIGTAATPLITALQKSALIGSIEVKFNATPSSVAVPKLHRSP